MKISGNTESNAVPVPESLTRTPASTPTPGQVGGAAGGAAPVAGGAVADPQKDSVELSPALRSLQESDQPFDQAKVDKIKKAIASGNFQIDPERVADRMIKSAAELLERIWLGPADSAPKSAADKGAGADNAANVSEVKPQRGAESK